MTTLEEVIGKVPGGWRWSVGHTPYYGKRPKHLNKKPFEAYVVNDHDIGTIDYVFVSADGATPAEALQDALMASADKLIEIEVIKEELKKAKGKKK